ncbi:MAG: sugar ABC transporter substrate-binding protein [Chloroflexi bacterium]|nr:sugar ABC transporter substrate-binding protein [Chloroflexota bacterium]
MFAGRVKNFCLLILASLLIIIAGGCASRANTDKIRLEFWTISLKPTYNDYMNGLIGRYEKLHPDVELEWIDLPINVVMQKLMASIAGGASPDVVNLNTDYALILAQNNALVSMDKMVPADIRAGYFENLWEASRWKGESYAVPWYVSTQLIMYNKKIFKEAGLPEAAPATWDEVVAVSKAVRKKTGFYGFMPAVKLINDWRMNGVPVLDESKKHALFDRPEAVAYLEWYVNLRKQDLIPAETLVLGYQGALDRYQAGSLGMLITGPQFLLRIAKNAPDVYAATAVGPYPPGRAGIVPVATMNFVVPRASKNRGKAVDLALFLTGDENQLEFCKLVPLLPSRKKAASDEFFEKGKGSPLEDDAIRISVKQLSYGRDLSLGVKDSNNLVRILNQAVESAFYGRQEPAAVLREAAKQWDEILGGN